VAVCRDDAEVGLERHGDSYVEALIPTPRSPDYRIGVRGKYMLPC